MTTPDWQIEGTMAKAEYDALIRALEACDYKVLRTADMLRIGRSTVYRLLAEFDISLSSVKRAKQHQTISKRKINGDHDGYSGSRIVVVDGRWYLAPDDGTKLENQ